MKEWLLIALITLAACAEKQEATTGQTAENTGALTTIEGMSWQVPAGWLEEAPTSAMRKAQYGLPLAAGDPENGEVIVFFFGGDGGGVQDNIERWCSWFKKPDGSPARDLAVIETATVNNLKQTSVDIKGTYLFKMRPMAPTATEKPGFRMLGAVVEAPAGSWFVRCVGPEATIARWEQSFHDFLRSVKTAEISRKG